MNNEDTALYGSVIYVHQNRMAFGQDQSADLCEDGFSVNIYWRPGCSGGTWRGVALPGAVLL